MLVCFGISWPFALYKTYKTKNVMGKSFLFMCFVIIGYICGILHKIYYNYDIVLWLYAINCLMVSTDLALSCYYKKRQQMN